MKKSTKALSAILSLSSVASVVAPVTTMAATTTTIDTLLATAAKTKTFADYHTAYKAYVKLSAADQAKYAAKLVAVYNAVPQVAEISKLINDQVAIGTTANAEDFWKNYNAINATVTSTTDKAYLVNELAGWGLKLLDKVPGYTAATDAIMAAAAKVTAHDVDGANAAIDAAKTKIAAVTHVANNAYLTKTLKTDVQDKLDAYVATLALKVNSVAAVSAKRVEVKFNQAVDKATLFQDGVSGAFILNTVALNSIDSVNAGTITGALSSDGKTLTITTTNAVSKRYDVVINLLKSATGKAMDKYQAVSTFAADTTAPTIVGTSKPTAGTVKVTFSEPMQSLGTASFKLADGTVLVADPTGAASTGVSYLHNDGDKEVTFTLGSDVAANANVTATFIGAQDQAGNLLTPNPATATLFKGASDGVAPTVAAITQESATKFTVKFSEQLNGKPTVVVGVTTVAAANVVQDTTDLTVYHVTAPAVLDGATTIAVSAFTDLTGVNGTAMSKVVTFTKDTAAPTVVSTAVAADATDGKQYLEITFDKDVNLSTATVVGSGSYVKDYVTTSGLTLNTGNTVAYKASSNKKVVRVQLDSFLAASDVSGAVYSLNLVFSGVTSDAGIAAAAKDVSFTRGDDGSAANSAVVGIVAVTRGSDNNKVNVQFDRAVDGASAITVANYRIDGAVVESVTLQPVAGDLTQTAVLNLKAGSNGFTGTRNINISGVKASGSTATMNAYFTNSLSLNENVAPTITAAKLTATDKVTITLSETVTNTADADDFVLYVGGEAVAANIVSTPTAAGTTIVLSLATPLTATDMSKGLTLKAASTLDIADSVGNKVSVPTTGVAIAQ